MFLLMLLLHRTFQSTPSVWRETWETVETLRHRYISIHSLRMEGDLVSDRRDAAEEISIHSLRMEGDRIDRAQPPRERDFNPLPPYGGRLLNATLTSQPIIISIHSLRMEGDQYRIS